MFEAAELGNALTPKRYDAELPKLRSDLLNTHFDLRDQKFQVIVIVSGADGAGKGVPAKDAPARDAPAKGVVAKDKQ